jgi:acyl-CoA thioesterase
MQLVEAELRSGDKTWVRTTALRARISDSPAHAEPLTHPLPQEPVVSQDMAWAEIVRASGDFKVRGPGAMWVRLTADVVEGEPLTALQRMAAVADFGSGAAPLVPYRHWTSANLDIVMNFSRLAQGEWLLIDATSESAGNGIGIANARMGDQDGMFATAAQTLFLNPRAQ